jgi:anaerobic selenocysteine-containing dehydrogenase
MGAIETLATDNGTDQIVAGACPHDCPDTCALLTTVRAGRVIKVAGNPAHPMTDGVLCTKVARYDERLYHPERVLTPLKRVGPKGSGQFAPVSWDEALDDIGQRLSEIAARDPRAVLPYHYAGTMGQVQGGSVCTRFFNRLGASQLDQTICASAGSEALRYTLGAGVGMPVEAFAHAKTIVIWGSNPITSNLHFWRIAQRAKRDGAKIICIDPRRTETAEKCHAHLAIKPGTDAALALAVMQQCVVHGWLDQDYLDQYTVGWARLRERALEWTPERAAEVCGIEPDQVRELARDLATVQPAAIRLNYGVQRVKGGANAVRAILCIPAVTGAWRHTGGGALLSSSGFFPKQTAAMERPDLRNRGLAGRPPRVVNMTTIGDDLLRESSEAFGPKIEAVVVFNSNPVAIAPDSKRVSAGFRRDDLFTVVLEHFMTDTADCADYVLPATMQLEHWDVHASYGHTDVLLNRPAVPAAGQAKPNTEVFRQLAQRMGFDDPCLQDDDQSLCRQAFDAQQVSFDTLLDQGFVALPVADAPFAQGGFPTPSGRCELFSQRLADQGLDGLPNHIPNAEPGSAPFPLAMISPPARHFLNSSFVNVASLQAVEREPLLEMHRSDASARGIASGDVVEVFNERGRYHCVARVNDRARLGVVIGLGVWWRKLGLAGTNVNELTSQVLTDLGRAPTFYDCAVEVRKAAVVDR